MARSRKGTFLFFISMSISFLILASIFLIALLLTKASIVTDIPKEDVPYESAHRVTGDENLSVLVLCCDTPESMPDVAVLFHYNAPLRVVSIITIPTIAISSPNGRTDTLQGHYDYESMRGGVNAVKDIFSIEVDRYVRLQKAGVANIIDYLGGLPYTIENDKTIGKETILKGEQLLDGRRVATLLFSKNELNICDYAFQSELISKLANKNFNEAFIPKYDKFISTFFYNAETNVNRYDFAKRQAGIVTALMHNDIEIREIILTGQYNENHTGFYVSKESVEMVQGIVNP